MFDREGGGLVFESFFSLILFTYDKNITKLVNFNENFVSWYILLFPYFRIEYMQVFSSAEKRILTPPYSDTVKKAIENVFIYN